MGQEREREGERIEEYAEREEENKYEQCLGHDASVCDALQQLRAAQCAKFIDDVAVHGSKFGVRYCEYGGGLCVCSPQKNWGSKFQEVACAAWGSTQRQGV